MLAESKTWFEGGADGLEYTPKTAAAAEAEVGLERIRRLRVLAS